MLHALRGECDVFNGHASRAVPRTRSALEIATRYPVTWGHVLCMWNFANAKLSAGDEDAAIALFSESAEVSQRNGFVIGEMCTVNVLGQIWETRGALEKSRCLWERALFLRRQIGGYRMGYVHGSMATSLLAIGRIALRQGDLTTAAQLLREALPFAEDIRDTETAQQITELLQQVSRTEPIKSGMLRHDAGVWHIAFDGKSVHVPDMKGLWHLRELVSRPREPISALTLIAVKSDEPILVGDAGPQLDREALRQYRKRLAVLDDEIEDAEARHDTARHTKRSAERVTLLQELARATGLGGKQRRTGSAVEKARLNVTRTIRHAITYLASTAPELAAHLDESLVTGVACSYEPQVNVAWET